MTKQEKQLYTLIPLEDFKTILGVDDREDKLSRFCLASATQAIEQYCMRRFLRKKYSDGNVPADLASACLELAAWNFNRYRSRRIGMTGNVRKDGEHFEMSMPENVKSLLEAYRRKTI